MRFRKSVTIFKGCRLNYSKSGVSLTAGFKGASQNYDLVNSSERIKTTNRRSLTMADNSTMQYQAEVSIGIEDNGKPTIYNQYGNIITDESLIRKIKRTAQYKDSVKNLIEQRKSAIDHETTSFINIHQQCPKLIKKDDVLTEMSQLNLLEYPIKNFDRKKPDLKSIRTELINESQEKVKSFAFWTLNEKRRVYVETRVENSFKEAMVKWNLFKDNFEKAEIEKKKTEDIKHLEEYKQRKSELESFLNGHEDYVIKNVDKFLSKLELPIKCTASYEYSEKDCFLLVDLDLPEIEDVPEDKAIILSSGKLKLKQKTQKELREDYIRCIIGLSFFFTASLFNISTMIEKILISGYSQRIDKKTGNINDEYIYSIIYNRNDFEKLNIENIDPYQAFLTFKNKIDLSKSTELKAIIPFDKNEVEIKIENGINQSTLNSAETNQKSLTNINVEEQP